MSPVRVKICGLTRPDEALQAIDSGADALGLNFYTKSPRCLTLAQAQVIQRALPTTTTSIGVFVDHSRDATLQIMENVPLQGVQSYDSTLLGQFPRSVTHWPAFRIGSVEQLKDLEAALAELQAADRLPDAILVDSFVPGELGGTGHVAPWDLLRSFRSPVPLILAGGLTPENVAEAIERVRPWGVDVASGVESAPGRKDPGKVRAFVQAVRSVTGGHLANNANSMAHSAPISKMDQDGEQSSASG